MKLSLSSLHSALLLAFAPFAALAFNPAEYSYQIPLTVSGYTGPSALAGFPVLVRLSETIPGFSYSTFRSDSGADLLFVDTTGTPLPHEIDTWNPSGESLVWVRLPSLSPNTPFFAYFGSDLHAAGDGTALNPAVWDQYLAVWHFGDAETDATGLNTTLTKVGVTPLSPGRIGSAYSISTGKSGIATQNVVTNEDGSACASFSLSAWVKPARAYSTGNARVVSSKSAYTGNGFEYILSNGKLLMRGDKNNRTYSNNTAWNNHFSVGAWTHIAGVFNNTVAKDYYNGALDGSGSGSIATITTASYKLGFGNFGGGTGTFGTADVFQGALDEVRFYRGEASADWIAAEYATVSEPSFLSIGSASVTDSNFPVFEGTPTLTATADGSFLFSTTLASGIGSIYAIYTDVLSGQAATNLVAANADASLAPLSLSLPLTLPAGATYSFAALATTSQGGNLIRNGAEFVFAGEVSIANGSDANEQTLASGTVIVTRPNTPSAIARDLILPYTLSGSALSGDTFEPLSGFLILPAGETSATLSVTPLFCPEIDEDTSLTITFLPSSCFLSPPASATLTLINSSENIYTLYVDPEGDDANSGLNPSSPKATILAAVKALSPIATDDTPGTIFVAPGTYREISEATVYNALRLTQPIRIIGSSGNPADVVISPVAQVSSEKVRVAYLNHPLATLQYLTLTGGTQNSGVCVYIAADGGNVLDCIIRNVNNGTWNAYGALYMLNGLVARCHFKNNAVNAQGCALHMEGGIAENCLFTHNTCNAAHVAYLTGYSILQNCTITENTGTSSAGVAIMSADARAINCAIFNNTVTENNYGHVRGGNFPTGFFHCAADAVIPSGENCIVGDPAFVDPENGDYRLLPSSCCLDAGTLIAPALSTPTLDHAQAPRLAGSAIDIGCYENPQTEPAFAFSFQADHFFTPSTLTFTPATIDIENPEEASVTWSFGDGTTATTIGLEPVQHTYLAASDYPVSATLTSGTTTLSFTYPSPLHIVSQTLYINGGNPNAAAPYDQPEIGFPTVAAAVAYAVDRCSLNILPGTLIQQYETIVDKGLFITGTTGKPADVVLSNDPARINSNRARIFILNHPDAVVASLTMTLGSAHENNAHGGNVYIKSGGGTVSNCVIRSGRSQHFASNGAAAYLKAGLLTHTEITGEFLSEPAYNNNPNGLAVVVHIDGASARMENCLVHDITFATNEKAYSSCGPIVAVAQGTIANCTIAPNCQLPVRGYEGYNGGAALYCSNKAFAYNCVATGLLNTNGVLTAFSGTASRFYHCAGDSEIPWAGINQIQGTPSQFYRDAEAGDYRPHEESLLVNSGLNSGVLGTSDLAQKDRIIDRTIDIGCFEWDSRATRIFIR